MVNINIELTEKEHNQLWNQKEELSIFFGRNVSWKEFILNAMNKKIRRK